MYAMLPAVEDETKPTKARSQAEVLARMIAAAMAVGLSFALACSPLVYGVSCAWNAGAR